MHDRFGKRILVVIGNSRAIIILLQKLFIYLRPPLISGFIGPSHNPTVTADVTALTFISDTSSLFYTF